MDTFCTNGFWDDAQIRYGLCFEVVKNYPWIFPCKGKLDLGVELTLDHVDVEDRYDVHPDGHPHAQLVLQLGRDLVL